VLACYFGTQILFSTNFYVSIYVLVLIDKTEDLKHENDILFSYNLHLDLFGSGSGSEPINRIRLRIQIHNTDFKHENQGFSAIYISHSDSFGSILESIIQFGFD